MVNSVTRKNSINLPEEALKSELISINLPEEAQKSKLTFVFDSSGNLLSLKNKGGIDLECIYDSRGRIIQIKGAQDKLITFDYSQPENSDVLTSLPRVLHSEGIEIHPVAPVGKLISNATQSDDGKIFQSKLLAWENPKATQPKLLGNAFKNTSNEFSIPSTAFSAAFSFLGYSLGGIVSPALLGALLGLKLDDGDV